MNNISSNQIIKIIQIGTSCDFDPKQIEVRGGDTVTFMNTSDNPASISFSNHELFNAAYLNLGPGKEQSLQVKSGDEVQCWCQINCNTASPIVFYASKPEVIIIRK